MHLNLLTEESRKQFMDFCIDGRKCGFRLKLINENDFFLEYTSLNIGAIGTIIQPYFNNYGDYFILSDGEFIVSNLKQLPRPSQDQ